MTSFARTTKRILTAWVAVALFVFSQLAVAGYACAQMDIPLNTPSEHCVSAKKATVDMQCKVHCEKDAQAPSAVSLPLASMPMLVSWLERLPQLAQSHRVSVAFNENPDGAPPPIVIQFQRFLI